MLDKLRLNSIRGDIQIEVLKQVVGAINPIFLYSIIIFIKYISKNFANNFKNSNDKRIKTFLRDTMRNDRTNRLEIISIQINLVHEMNNFDDDYENIHLVEEA